MTINFNLIWFVSAKKHECEVCLRDFTQRTSLNRHMKTVHADLMKQQEEANQQQQELSPQQQQIQIKQEQQPQPVLLTSVAPQQQQRQQPTEFIISSPLPEVSETNDQKSFFKCEICNKSYSNKAYLKVHERIHSGEKPFQCTICNRCFNQSGSLNRHMKFCHPATNTPPSQVEINNKQEGIVILKIELIDKETGLGVPAGELSQNGIMQDEETQVYYTDKDTGMEITHQIDESGQIVVKQESAELYYNNKEIQLPNSLVVKEEATQVYYTANPEDITHLQQNGFIVKNENAEVFYADNSMQNIQMHVADENGTLVVKDDQVYLTELGPTEVVLTEMPQAEMLTESMQVHEAEHFIDQPTEVIISDLNAPPSLEEQIITEQYPESSKDFECPVCFKRFASRAYLTVHKRIHTGEKPYECKVCDKRFNHSGSLYRHKKIHQTT